MAMENSLSDIVNLNQYPIHDLNSKIYNELTAHCKSELDAIGCCVIPNFIKPDSINKMLKEISSKRDRVFWSDESHNPYFSKRDDSLPNIHPVNTFGARNNGYLNGDLIPENSDLHFLYHTEELKNLVSNCLGIHPLFHWADPLAKNVYNCMDPGNCFPWHFDSNEFTLSILIQKAEEGCNFEYVPNLRKPNDENFDGVKKVLNGDRENVRVVKLEVGDLQIFKGRFSMHRVSKVEGNTTRYIALPTYTLDGWRVNTPEHSRVVYGKVLPIHYERNVKRADSLKD